SLGTKLCFSYSARLAASIAISRSALISIGPPACHKPFCLVGRPGDISDTGAAGERAGRMAWRIGVDIGGTFTDVAAIDEASGRIGIVKLLTTPEDCSRAVVEGLRRAIERERIDP